MAGVTGTVTLTAVAAIMDAPTAVFCMIWVASLGIPAIPATFWALRSIGSIRPGSNPISADPSVRSISRDNMWISCASQLAIGFDLVIITAIVGSVAAGTYGLVTRLAAIASTITIGSLPVLLRVAGEARAHQCTTSGKSTRRTVAAVLALQLVGIIAFVAVCGTAAHILTGNQISISISLAATAGAWALLDSIRRCLAAITSTTDGLRVWRQISVPLSIANALASVILTMELGMIGPLVASAVACAAIATLGAYRLRKELAEVFFAGR
ncbi:hypothetical protein [Nocardioides sp. YIM 152588]|uniref:hypothetical protein n=1 Tax=Nocardioides sp. YIM 152588 TaxID=3158259 RepID=UPI0032E3915D